MNWNTKLTQLLTTKSIQVWKVLLPLEDNTLDKLTTNLSSNEIQKANQFHFKSDRDIYICARGALRELIAFYLKVDPKIICFNYNQYGKPYLEKAELQFNISHSGRCILIAFSLGIPIGVDVEDCQKDIDFLSIAKDFFSPNEYQKLHALSLDERKLAFYRCWTRKEAILKAIGKGLSVSTKKIEVSLLPTEKVEILNFDNTTTLKKNWSLLELIPESNYIGAVAVGRKNNDALLQDWNSFKRDY